MLSYRLSINSSIYFYFKLKLISNKLTWIVFMCLFYLIHGAWQDNLLPKIYNTYYNDSSIVRFLGNTSYPDHFKLLMQDGDYLIIGARNIMYNLSLYTFDEQKRLEWHTPGSGVDLCSKKGKSYDLCQNYIRVVSKKANGELFICGTNAFKPKCRSYTQSSFGYNLIKEFNGEGLCPYDPHHNSTFVFAEENLFVGTSARFSGDDDLISRLPLRTEQSNPKQLNAPNFVNSLHIGDHVYFFFREIAVENINCKKVVFSRIARVCANDKGYGYQLRNRWTSYFKARLNCSVPGNFPFYFDEIQATSGLVNGMYNGRKSQVIYGIFSTPENSLSASAICAYQLQDIFNTFNGPFKGQENSNSNWLPVPMMKVPEPHPGQCVNNSYDLPESSINFIKDHSLMDRAVNPLWGAPVLIQTSFNFRYTKIAVDPQVQAMYGKTFDILFIGTNRGQVIKAINSASNAMNGHHYHNKVVPVIIEEMTVFSDGSPVTNLLLYNNPRHQPKLIVSSASEIKSIPLSQCEKRAKTCSECVALQDPYCVWDISASICTKFSSYKYQYYLQNIEEGWSSTCPDGHPPLAENPDHKPKGVSRTLENEVDYAQMFTGETLAFSIVTSVVTSLVIGFIIGYIFSKRCKKDDPNSFSYTDPAGYLDRRNYHQHRLPQDNYSSLGQPPLTKPINLVLNVPPKNRKNANSSADNKPIQKVKKIYL